MADPDVPSRKSYSLIHSSISMLFHLWYMLQLASPSNSTWATIRRHRRFSRDSTCTLSVNFDEWDDFWYEGLTSPGYDFRKWKDLNKVIISEAFFRSLNFVAMPFLCKLAPNSQYMIQASLWKGFIRSVWASAETPERSSGFKSCSSLLLQPTEPEARDVSADHKGGSKYIFFFNLPFNTVHNVHRQPLYKPQI